MRHLDLRHGPRRWGAVLAVAAAVGMAATPVLAASTADQSYLASFTPDVVHDVNVLAQTFTPSRTGALTRVDLSIGRFDNAGPLTVSIETTSAGKPTGIVLASTTLPLSTVPNDGDVHPVVVTLPPSLGTATTQYAIVLSAPLALPDTAWLWEQDDPGSYGPGTALEGDTNLGTWTIESGVDHTFTTYVDSTPCAPGYYSGTGYGVCTAADPGSFVAAAASTSESPCPIGTFQPLAASAGCNQAPVGYYVPTTGATAAIAAGPGQFVDAQGSATQTDCAAGTFQPNAASAGCNQAPVGYYVPTTGATAPTAADPGHFVATTGSATQTQCPLGSYQPASAAASCILAPVGSYVDATGAVAATPCPNGALTAGEGSTSISACIVDTTPPVITYTVTGTQGLNGWYTGDVTLTWSVVEPETPGSLVTTGCENQVITTDQAATTYSCSASSIGGSAGPVTVTIKRDATPPSIACSASPGVLWPPNNKLVPVTVTVTTAGASSFTLTSVSASSGVAGDMQGWTTGTPDTSGLLRASRSGTGGARTYTLTYQAADDAGNTAGCTTTVVVPHDMGAR